MSCPICKKNRKTKNFPLIVKDSKKNKIYKKKYKFNIGYCSNCTHGFIEVNNDVFKASYSKIYPSGSFSDSIKNSKNIYTDIISFIKEYKFKTCCDLGGDDGSFFHKLRSKDKKIKKFTIYDTRPVKKYSQFDYVNLNLNKFENLKKINSHDFAFLIHTLEHLKNPLDFLKNLNKLKKFRYIYIEVPSLRLIKAFGSVGLVGVQHLHYFTINSLTNILNLSGFVVEKIEEKTTNGVPRLKCIAKRVKYDYLSDYLKTEKNKIKKISKYIINKKPYLYGCGDIFEKIINHKIKQLINKNLISIFDNKLGGNSYNSIKIKKPLELKKLKNKDLLILPVYRDVQKNIIAFLKKLKIKNKIILASKFN